MVLIVDFFFIRVQSERVGVIFRADFFLKVLINRSFSLLFSSTSTVCLYYSHHDCADFVASSSTVHSYLSMLITNQAGQCRSRRDFFS